MRNSHAALIAALAITGNLFAQGGGECATAEDVASALSFPYSTGFTTEADQCSSSPYSATGLFYGDVWFTWTAPTTDPYRCWSTGMDGVLAVYSGASCGALSSHGCNDTPGISDLVDFNAVAGGLYWIRIGGYIESGGGSGIIDMIAIVDNDGDGFDGTTDCDDSDPLINPAAVEIYSNGVDEDCDGQDNAQPAANDTCASAFVVSAAGSVSADNSAQTSSGVDAACSPGVSGGPVADVLDLWYEFIAPSTGLWRINTCGSTYNTTVAAYSACGGATLECNSDSAVCGGAQSNIDVATVAGTSYYIQVSGWNSLEVGTGTLTFLDISDTDGDGFHLDTDCDDTNPLIFPGAVEICGNGIDEDCNGIDDPVCPPANDECAGATPVMLGLNPVSTVLATASGVLASGLPPYVDILTPDTGCLDNGNGFELLNNDVWHTFAAPSNGQFLFSTCAVASYDTKLAIYSGACGAEIALACNDDGLACAAFASELRVTLMGGSNYLLQVGAFGPSQDGTAVLDIQLETSPPTPGTNYCPLTPNSAGPGTVISASGTSSATGTSSVFLNDLVLEASGGPALETGVFFYGPSQIQVPFGEGNRCVGGSVIRLWPPSLADATGFNSRAVDNTAPAIAGSAAPIVVGGTQNFQYWHRDPAGGGTGFNLSDALEITFSI